MKSSPSPGPPSPRTLGTERLRLVTAGKVYSPDCRWDRIFIVRCGALFCECGHEAPIPGSGGTGIVPVALLNSQLIREGRMATEKLFTKELIALNGVMFLVYCNIAVFFEFHHYLATLPIEPQSYGLLIGLFSVSMLLIRPVISPFLHPGNAGKWIGISCGMVIAALLSYHAASGFWSMAVVRLVHGTAHVILATAVVAGLIACIPPDRSAQAFGLISVITLLPYAVIPPVLDPATRMMGGFLGVLDLSACVMAFSFPLLAMVRGERSGDTGPQHQRLGWTDIVDNLRDRPILILLLVSLLLWSSFAPVFYFLRGHGDKLGVANPGWFFTLSGFTEIGVRLAAGGYFDRLNKRLVLLGSLIWLMVGNVVMAHVSGEWIFYGMGLFMGLGWGVAMPVLSGLVFDYSEPRLRALNTNLTFQMFQAGFFLGPLVGGFVLVHGGYGGLYYLCAALTAVGAIAAWLLVPSKFQEGWISGGNPFEKRLSSGPPSENS